MLSELDDLLSADLASVTGGITRRSKGDEALMLSKVESNPEAACMEESEALARRVRRSSKLSKLSLLAQSELTVRLMAAE